jgi:hypothetical protein
MYDFADLLALTQDRPLRTPEIHTPNDFYGHASLLKHYAGLPQNYPLKLIVEHGPHIPGDRAWTVDLNANLPIYCVSSDAARQSRQKQIQNKYVCAIGPLIAYANLISFPEELTEIKDKLGKNLLIFPSHSTHHIEAIYNEQLMLKDILDISKDFNSVTICSYWKDFNKERFDMFKSVDFYCTSAGHIYDNTFLNRLLTYLLLSDAVLCFDFSTAFIYAFYLNKFVMLLPLKDFKVSGQQKYLNERSPSPIPSKAAKYFKEFTSRSSCSVAQYDLLDQCGGFDNVKTRQNMYNLIIKAEERYINKKMTFLRLPSQ